MKEKNLLRRVGVLVALVILVLLLYLLRLMQLQVVMGADFAKEIEEGWESIQTIKAARGEILDRNGRPMAVNTIGRDVVIDQAYLVPGSTNDVILKLIRIMEDADEEWIDTLPLSQTAPFVFLAGQDDRVARLKSALGLAAFATADDCVYFLKKIYQLEEHSDADFRKAAGVGYEMTQRGFSMAAPYTFATNIKIETVPRIKERSFELQGVDVVESAIRQYVSGDIAPHVIGSYGPIYREQWNAADEYLYNDRDGTSKAVINGQSYSMTDSIGKAGVELAFEGYLKGKDGIRRVVQNSSGHVIDVVEEQAQTPGNTVILTIDSRIQKVTQEALEKKILAMQKDLVTYPPGKGHEADAGAVAVFEIKTGEVLALATYPSYNLTTYQKDYAMLANPGEGKPGPLVNRAVAGGYTPGSIFKPVVALGGLSEGIVTKEDRVQCNMVYDVMGWPRYCLSAHGAVDVVNALRWSCNIYFYDVGRRLGIDKIDEYAAKLGMGLPTGIELQDEYVGRVASKDLKWKLRNEAWQEGDTVQASIGQLDTRLSPVALANYCATLASGGTRMKATLLKSVRSYGFDQVIYEHTPEVAEQIDSPAAFAAIKEGMIAASSAGGTSATTFANYRIKTASKTGTPETAQFPNSTFIAYAPADDPQIAVCVIIEKGWHGYTGAPVARDIFDAYFVSEDDKTSGELGYNQLLP